MWITITGRRSDLLGVMLFNGRNLQVRSTPIWTEFGALGTSLLIVLLGMLVPVLAAAPFYIADRRDDRRRGAETSSSATEGVGESEGVGEPDSGEEAVDPGGEPRTAEPDEGSGSAVHEIPAAREAVEDDELPGVIPNIAEIAEAGHAEVRA
ncbi:hypothetical protein GCM10009854_36620 [Saccharopolyspora halophila]|uniref:Uncharacterized protein n=2 Tax=Saccharopolyspora halophila TaxID=405551 RepID=A0ABP5TKW2_9PSEU